jgi:hypothetical protein
MRWIMGMAEATMWASIRRMIKPETDGIFLEIHYRDWITRIQSCYSYTRVSFI